MEENLYTMKKSGRDNYLVLIPQSVPLYEMEILNRKNLRGSLPIEIALQGGATELWYKLTGCISIRTLLEMRKFGEAQMLELMRSIYLFSQELEKHLLNPVGIVIGFDTIFYKEEGQFLFCYNPNAQKELKEDLLTMTEELLTLIDYKNQKLVKFLYHIYEVLNQKNPDYEQLQYSMEEAESKDWQAEEIRVYESTEEEKGDRQNQILQKALPETDLQQKTPAKSGVDLKVQAAIKAIKDGKEKLGQWLLNQTSSLRKKTVKKLETYTDIRPIIVRAGEEEENPTVLLSGPYHTSGTYCLQSRDQENERIFLTKDRIIIGKNTESADEIIADDSVSRRHAFITKEEEKYYLEDLNSLNGTYINGERLGYKEKVCLQENDVIAIGGKTFCFCSL